LGKGAWFKEKIETKKPQTDCIGRSKGVARSLGFKKLAQKGF